MAISVVEVTNFNFWDTIDEWTDSSIVNAEFIDNVSSHEKIYEECEKFDGWTGAMDFENQSYELRDRFIKIAKETAEPSKDTTAINEKHDRYFTIPGYGNYGMMKSHDGSILSDDNPVYWWCVPEEKDFPTLHKFMKENPKYIYPVISKMSPHVELIPHDHGPEPKYCYNMAVNVSEGSRFAMYPTGNINYKAGDIYKLYVNNRHSVINGNETRYHVLFRGGLIYG